MRVAAVLFAGRQPYEPDSSRTGQGRPLGGTPVETFLTLPALQEFLIWASQTPGGMILHTRLRQYVPPEVLVAAASDFTDNIRIIHRPQLPTGTAPGTPAAPKRPAGQRKSRSSPKSANREWSESSFAVVP